MLEHSKEKECKEGTYQEEEDGKKRKEMSTKKWLTIERWSNESLI